MGFHGGGWFSYIRYDEEQDRPEVSQALISRVGGYARPYWRGIVIILATMIGISLLSLIPPLLMRDLLDNALPQRDFVRLNLLALGMIAVPLINGLLGVAQRYASARIGEGIIFDLRRALYAHLQRMSLRFYTHTQVGEMMSRLNNDVIGAQRAVTGTLVTLVSNIFSLIATLVIMLSLEWRLTLLGVAILPLFVLPARRVGDVLRRIARQSLELNARMNAMMNETLNISGALLVKIFGRYRTEVKRFAENAAKVRDVGIRQAVIGRWFFLALSLVSAIGTALVFWVGGHLVLRGVFTIGTIVAFSVYLRDLYGPLTSLTNARVEFATSMVSFERVFEVLDLPIEITDRPEALTLANVQGHLRFEEVAFSYEEAKGAPVGLEEIRRFTRHAHSSYVTPKAARKGGDGASVDNDQPVRYALQDVDFEIQPGQVAALVGPSGAGKTTITYLLPRLYDPTEGRVTFDGHDLRELTLESLADHVGMVTQETYLFHATLRENLLYAKPDATQEELETVCRAANIHDFIASLPEGYDTVVGERGYRLSGGEKQRVAIARVLLKDPKVLILDEATSHLDSQSEALIQDAMERVMRGRTSLVIAHRLSTVMDADLILVMDKGRLIEQGSHEDLLARGGLYARLYETQFYPQAG
ncbi:MAG: ABC transporter [Anaerolineae bacterium SM23_ 63]|nr:MAG: ABC transporter [Anaerolineae bacterium SM23_ 63]HEY46088.1 ABC transporter ATP-binding protein [Anaerolineae bacterium]